MMLAAGRRLHSAGRLLSTLRVADVSCDSATLEWKPAPDVRRAVLEPGVDERFGRAGASRLPCDKWDVLSRVFSVRHSRARFAVAVGVVLPVRVSQNAGEAALHVALYHVEREVLGAERLEREGTRSCLGARPSMKGRAGVGLLDEERNGPRQLTCGHAARRSPCSPVPRADAHAPGENSHWGGRICEACAARIES